MRLDVASWCEVLVMVMGTVYVAHKGAPPFFFV